VTVSDTQLFEMQICCKFGVYGQAAGSDTWTPGLYPAAGNGLRESVPLVSKEGLK